MVHRHLPANTCALHPLHRWQIPCVTFLLTWLLVALPGRPAFCQAQKPRLVVQFGHSLTVNSVAFSPDGETLASAGSDQSIKLWETATGELIRTLTGHTGAINSVAFSPDGRTLASGSDDHTVMLWDAATGRLLRTLTGAVDYFTCITFSPDGRTIACATRDSSLTIRLWDAKTGEELRTITDHGELFDKDPNLGGPVASVVFSPDGKTLISGGYNGSIIFWNVATGQLLRYFWASGGSEVPPAFSPDGKTLASGSRDRTIKIWDVATGQQLRALTGDNGNLFNSVAFSPDGKTLASGSGDGPYAGKIQFWDISTGQQLRTLTGVNDGVNAGVFNSVAFSPDGKTLASGGGSIYAGPNHPVRAGIVKFWAVATGKERHTIAGFSIGVNSVAFSPDGKTIYSGSFGNAEVRRWDTETGQAGQTFADHTPGLTSVGVNPDGRTLTELITPPGPPRHAFGQSIALWDAATGSELRTLTLPPLSDSSLAKGDTSGVTSAVFSPDTRTLASVISVRTYDGVHSKYVSITTIKLWDAATGQLLRTLTVNGGRLAFSPDGKTLASGSTDDHGDNTVQLWDVGTGQQLHILPLNAENPSQASHPLDPFAQHFRAVTSVAFSPDGRTLASAAADVVGTAGVGFTKIYSEDYSIQLWDVPTGQQLRTLAGHTSAISSVAFSPDGRSLASGSEDGTVKLWDISTSQELCSLSSLGDTDWAVVTPDGRFDTGNLDDIQGIHWVLPDQPFTPVPVEAFFSQYYTPGLLAHLLRRDLLPPLPDISTINHVQPTVAIDAVVPHSGGDPALVDVTVSYTGQQADATQPDGTKKTDTSGVYDLRLFRNGQLVAALPEGVTSGVAPTDLSGGAVGKAFTHTFTVRLVRDGAKTVPFTAYAFNSDKVKSLTASRDYTPPQPLPVVQGRAWVLAFGADAYEDPGLLPDLRYAAADARAYGTGLVPRLTKTSRYAKVMFVPLISGTGPAHPDELPATKEALRATLDALAGKTPDGQDASFTPFLQKLGVTKAAPEDLLFLAFSCHGDADPKTGEYYLFPAHLDSSLTRWPDPALAARGLSSAELTAWMQGVDAGEMAMVIDSCHSGAVTGQAFKPGPMDSPGLGQLAYYKRMRILSASAANAVAKEYPDLGHGLLTAALVGDGLVNGQAKPAPGQAALTVGPWLTFAEADVPRLDARENGPATPAKPGKKGTAMDDPPAALPADSLQRPSLFDFHRVGVPDAVVAAGP